MAEAAQAMIVSPERNYRIFWIGWTLGVTILWWGLAWILGPRILAKALTLAAQRAGRG